MALCFPTVRMCTCRRICRPSLQRQFGRNMGAAVRFIARHWGDLIDDTRSFRPDGSIDREVVNYDAAKREYKGIQFTLERRFS